MKQQSKYVEVINSRMHYVEAGEGTPIVFVHGVPTSSRIWSAVMEPMSQHGRCIALDLIGHGLSDKPEIEYTLSDHIKYFTAFIDALELDSFYLVVHAWGSAIATSYAMNNQDKVKGIAFYESYLRPVLDWSMMSLPMQELTNIFGDESLAQSLTDPEQLIDKLLPSAMLNEMCPEAAEDYKQALIASNKQPLLKYLEELPSGHEPDYVTEIMRDYSQKLEASTMPKLIIYGVPGFNTTIANIAWAKEHLHKLTIVDIGPALHFAQQSNASVFADTLIDWVSANQ